MFNCCDRSLAAVSGRSLSASRGRAERHGKPVRSLSGSASRSVRCVTWFLTHPDILKEYSSDLRLIQNQLGYEHAAKDTTQLTVSQVELPFYSLVAHYDKRFSVGTDAHNAPRLLLVTHAAHQTAKPAQEPTLIITNRRVENADRLYVYNTPTK